MGQRFAFSDLQLWAEAWASQTRQAHPAAQIVVRYDRAHSDRPKAAVIVELLNEDRINNAIVWTSGECEVVSGRPPESVTIEHLTVGSRAELEALLGDLLAKYGVAFGPHF